MACNSRESRPRSEKLDSVVGSPGVPDVPGPSESVAVLGTVIGLLFSSSFRFILAAELGRLGCQQDLRRVGCERGSERGAEMVPVGVFESRWRLPGCSSTKSSSQDDLQVWEFFFPLEKFLPAGCEMMADKITARR